MREPINMVAEAEKLLGADNVSPEMADYLNEIEGFCRLQGGQIASRQVVAVAVATFREIERRERVK